MSSKHRFKKKRRVILEKCEEAIRLTSGIDFASFAHDVVENDKVLDYCNLKSTRQYEIKSTLKESVDKIFKQYKVENKSDCVDCLRYVERALLQSQPQQQSIIYNDTVIQDQLTKLSLPSRNQLVRLLSHSEETLNEDVLNIFPSLRAKSEHLLNTGRRKTRCDKMDVTFISDFMHAYCRYLQSVLCIEL